MSAEKKWPTIRDGFARRARQNFIDQDAMAMGIEDELAHLHADDFSSLTRDEYQQALETLGEHDHIDLTYEEDSPWGDVPYLASVQDEFFEEHLDSFKPFSKEHFNGNGYDVVAEISFDLSNEYEKATGVNLSLVAAHHERELIDELQIDSIPEGSGLYRIGHVPGLMGASDDFFTRDGLEAEDLGWEDVMPYVTQKRRYIDHLKSHGMNVMSIGGTDSIQVTMRPFMAATSDEEDPALDETFGDGYTRADMAADNMFRDFHGGGNHTSISALSPLFYAPFMNSPVLDEDGNLTDHMGREWAYRHGFKDSEWADNDKWGYVPETAYIQSMEDALDVFAEKISQFSAGVEADSQYVTVKGSDRSLYDVLEDDLPNLERDGTVNVRVGVDGSDTVDFTDIVERKKFEGIVSSSAGSGGANEVIVEVDYSDMDDDKFHETMWEHFQAHASGVWPSYRPRFDAGAFESRDYGNSPRIKEAVDTQAAVYLKWDELQEYADEELEMWEGYANILRDGIASGGLGYGDDADGLEFTLPSGHTVKEAWLGENGLDRGLLDILTDGVKEASYGEEAVQEELREEYAQAYRARMEQYLEEGTYAEVFARRAQEDGFDAAMADTHVYTESADVRDASR